MEAGAAQAVTQLVRQAARRGYGGLEFAEGIPGSVGGALVMNAGAYGSEFEKVVDTVYGMTQQGSPLQFNREQMRFTYRDSHLPQGTVVTRVRLSVHRQESSKVSMKVRELVTKRKSSQPSGYPNSGSMFRNPPDDYAGRLVEAAGLKGKQIGRAQISPKHGNFIVNLGGASAEDVRRLMELARAEVNAQFGVVLIPEVKLIGRWPSVRSGVSAMQLAVSRKDNRKKDKFPWRRRLATLGILVIFAGAVWILYGWREQVVSASVAVRRFILRKPLLRRARNSSSRRRQGARQ